MHLLYLRFNFQLVDLTLIFCMFKKELKLFLLGKKFPQLLHNSHIAVATLPDVDSVQVILVQVYVLRIVKEFLVLIFRQNLLRPTPINRLKQIHVVIMSVLLNLNCEISSDYCLQVDLLLGLFLKGIQTEQRKP